MGLLPLEFSDCLLDSPYFRENLRAHEKQLDQTATDIKNIINNIQVTVYYTGNCLYVNLWNTGLETEFSKQLFEKTG